MKIHLSDIRNTCAKRDHGDIEDLKESIQDLGLINPLTIDQNNNLLAGRRRFQAVSELGWEEVDVMVLEAASPLKALKIAIDENLRRKPLTDPEIRAAIALYDELKRELEGESKGGQRVDLYAKSVKVGWSQERTARDLGYNSRV